MSNYAKAGGGKILYFDCYSGISGDMSLGAMLDLGLDLEQLRDMLSQLKLPGYILKAEKVKKSGITGTQAIVEITGSDHKTRHLSDIKAIIEKANLPQPVTENSIAVFKNLAKAEAAVHGTSVEEVHFHEVGAVDAIVDIVGAACGLFLLGVDRVICSPLPLGRGEVKTAHGILPLPAPATLKILANREVPVRGSNEKFEMVTPTGAAIAATFADSFGALPDFTVQSVGYGSGTYDPGYPNYLRLLYGKDAQRPAEIEEESCLVETNIDDLNPEIYGYLMDKLFQAGALDVYFSAIQMKKNRPAVKVSIICPPGLLGVVRSILFAETTTLGIRVMSLQRIIQRREETKVETKWGSVRVKFASDGMGGNITNYAPEYEDCVKIARASGMPLKEIYALAMNLFVSRS